MMASSSSETRTCHPSPEQVETLVTFLEGRLDVAAGFGKNQARRIKSKQAWLKISLQLNNIPGTVKTTQRWIKYWSDKKSAVKKKAAMLEKCQEFDTEMAGTELSDIEERILAVIKKCEGLSKPLYREMKAEPSESQQSVNSTLENIETTFLLEEEMGGEEELQSESPNEESEDAFLSTYRFNNSNKSKARERNNHTSHTTKESKSRWGLLRLPPKSGPPPQPYDLNLVADKLCRIEKQRLELDRRMVDVMERNSDRDHILAEAVKAMGEGLKALAEAISRN